MENTTAPGAETVVSEGQKELHPAVVLLRKAEEYRAKVSSLGIAIGINYSALIFGAMDMALAVTQKDYTRSSIQSITFLANTAMVVRNTRSLENNRAIAENATQQIEEILT